MSSSSRGIEAALDHRLDVSLPFKHLAGVGGRVVASAGRRQNPREGLGDAVVIRCDLDLGCLGDSLAEDPGRDLVILVRLFVVVPELIQRMRSSAAARSSIA